jgi:hypothetical protein
LGAEVHCQGASFKIAEPMKQVRCVMEKVDRFVTKQNIERYKKLASGTLTGIQRLTILTLLAEEEIKYRNFPHSGEQSDPKGS